MNKFLAIVLSAFLIVGLIGCGSKKDKTENEIDIEAQNFISENSPKDDILVFNRSINEQDIQLIQFDEPQNGDLYATISTNLGDIHVRLFSEYTPIAVNNFVNLAHQDFYNGSEFYNVVQNFLIETGAPQGTKDSSIYQDSQGESIPFATETDINLWHFRGALAMKNDGESNPDSNTSQFFIVQASILPEEQFSEMREVGFPEKVVQAYEEHGGIPGFDGRYTVFGQVFAGMDVVDKIAALDVDEYGEPLEEIEILSISTDAYNHDLFSQSFPDPSVETESLPETESTEDIDNTENID